MKMRRTGAALAVIFMTAVSGCGKTAEAPFESYSAVSPFNSFRDIPGVTAQEIAAIEELQKKYQTFSFGVSLTTESFLKETGETGGFMALLCEWLTSLFDIRFEPAIFQATEAINKLTNGDLDFVGIMRVTEDRLRNYYMTDVISERRYVKVTLPENRNDAQGTQDRPLKYAFLQGFSTLNSIDLIKTYVDFDVVWVNGYDEAYALLKNGEIDAFIGVNAAEIAFEPYGQVYTENLYPLIFSAVAMAAANPEFEPVISAVQKAQRNGGSSYLNYLSRMGNYEYRTYKFNMLLNDEERSYINSHSVIPVAANNSNYPVCFFNARDNEWQGIFFDLLDEISALTGLSFNLVNESDTEWPVIYEKLVNGEVAFVPDLIHTPERKGNFIWPETALIPDYYALISRLDYPDISFNELMRMKVGLARDAAYTTMFKLWFPEHTNTVTYEGIEEAFNALQNGEVDIVMATQRRLLFLTHYRELPGYKANIVFEQPIETIFGFNKNETVLCSIIDKALKTVDTEGIAGRWLRRTYDYRVKVAEAQRPWLLGSTVMTLVILILILVLFYRSLSEGKRLEQIVFNRTRELSFQTATLTTLFDSIPDILYTKDMNLNYTRCNKRMEEYFGIKQEKLIGKRSLTSFGVSPEYLENHNQLLRKVLEDGSIHTVESPMPRFDGTVFVFEASYAPLFVNGVLSGILCIARDITQRKEMEKQLSVQTTTLRTIVDSIPDIIFCKDLEFKYTLCNKTLMDYFNISEENVIGNDSMNVFHFTGDVAKQINYEEQRVINDVRSIVREETLFSADGRRQLFETIIVPLKQSDAVIGLVGIARDITQRKVLEDEARNASEAKSRFVANMSHEMRTPMNVIVGLTDLMLEEENTPGDIKKTLRKINTAGNTLTGLINDVLDISKIEAGKLELMPVKYDIPSLLNDIIALNLIRIESKPITFKLDINQNLPCTLFGDDLRIKQILNNLLSNAFKYTQEGTITLGADCRIENDSAWLSFYVSDTGIGIRREDVAKLFTDYNQLDTRANRTIEGTGLGLSITKKFVDLMDGGITVESEYGKGSTFRAHVRQGFVNSTPIGRETMENLCSFRYSDKKKLVHEKLVRPNLNYARVLLVDDLPTNLDVAEGMLRKYKMQVDCVTSGKDAVDRISAGEPVYNAVFMDHMMPGMDGIEATTIIRSLGTNYAKNIPVIALTANAIAGNEQMFLDNGFNAFLPKPFNAMILDSIVQKWVRDKSKE